MLIPETTNKEYEPPPSGTSTAFCYGLVDTGHQEVKFADEEKVVRQIIMKFELVGPKTAKGSVYSISKTMTLSTHEKSTLRKFIEALIGRSLADNDLRGAKRFDLRDLLGKGCLLSITHAPKPDGGVSARVSGILALPAGTKVGKPVTEPEFLSLDGNFDAAVYDRQPSWIRDKVSRSPEYRELLAPKADLIGKVKAKRPTTEIIDDGFPDDWK